ncbi:MAG: hypothetical protein ACJA0I_001674 [Gammaproteobacteria bacterium]|jgi:hypothetical protein
MNTTPDTTNAGETETIEYQRFAVHSDALFKPLVLIFVYVQ